jgi:hypothetical protein
MRESTTSTRLSSATTAVTMKSGAGTVSGKRPAPITTGKHFNQSFNFTFLENLELSLTLPSSGHHSAMKIPSETLDLKRKRDGKM